MFMVDKSYEEMWWMANKNGFHVQLNRCESGFQLVVRSGNGCKFVNVNVSKSELPKACEVVQATMKEKGLWQ